ncbi:barwin-like endoglucanase [Aspergillus sclerotioniger CBS 115572]|uniref:Barwin-like endoglucanase n=1 Tax=Aspergillus sclerotioniger CBS 115572 TaxID=1450535 RepID=A0A317WYE9_9EURO|nr:barwin-like endoglucanase [Aspergillus sclerotioniger CBS 115572]PWY91424.1 barwin-like endoglucanase [Aspergillus sclerotioniger CBS 115572]
MKYQRLASLGVAALSAAASVSANPLFQREDEGQCPPGYTASVYYKTITLHPTSTAAVEPTSAPVLDSTSAPVVKPTSTTSAEPTSASAAEPTSTPAVESSSTASVDQVTTLHMSSTTTLTEVVTATPVPTTTSTTAASAATSSASSSTSSTSSSSSSSTASSSSSALSSEYSGEATFYGGNVSGGTCSFTDYTIPSSLFGTALSSQRWSNAAECGACVEVTGPSGNKIKAMIVDECPECDSNHLDLFEDAFAELADISKGVISIDWEYVSCGITTPIELVNKSGTSAYWFAMQVVNSNEPVTKLEVSTDSGSTWQSTTRSSYNFFENQSGFGTDTVDVRVTAQSGSQITVNNVSVSSGSSVTASSNFE